MTDSSNIYEALDRVIDFFSLGSSIAGVDDKIGYLNDISAEYSEDAGLFSVCLCKMLLSARPDLYRSVWSVVEYS